MAQSLGLVGFSAGVALVALLAVNCAVQRLRLWPPAHGSWQSLVFWGLFRTLNLSALALGALDWRPIQSDDALRALAAAAALVGGWAYLQACIHLGRVNLYCGSGGLVTTGIYAWSRNPQYAIAMPTYLALALAALSPALAMLTGMLVLVFLLMAIGEEPWLEATYGQDYIAYRSQVPRFYNVRRLIEQVHQTAARASKPR